MMRGVLLAVIIFLSPAAHAATVTRYSFAGATQSFTVAATGIYSISTLGGSGGNGLTSGSAATNGGLATLMRLSTQLNAGVTYNIVVGGAGMNATLAGSGGGGGGGSFHYAAARLLSQNIASTKGNGYVEFTLDRVLDPIPEPASWALMLAGFGLIGTTMRQRRMAAS